MSTLELIELFKTEMINEIYHNVSDDTLQNILINSVKAVESTVISTYKTEKHKKN